MDYLSLCLICKDENDYLPEWLDYHILMGVERFYIYDNESRVSLRTSLGDYIERGWVVVVDIPGRDMQLQAYDHCLQNFGAHTFWLGFIDTDEFLVPKTTLDLKLLLKEFEACAGLAVSALFFGSNGHKHRPAAGQISSYTRHAHPTFMEFIYVKSIVQPALVLMPHSPHDFIYQPGQFCVNENFLRVDGQRFPNSIQKIQLNHYYCRSEQEIDLKLSRGNSQDVVWPRKRFDLVNTLATYEDRSILNNLATLLGQPAGMEIWRSRALQIPATLMPEAFSQNHIARTFRSELLRMNSLRSEVELAVQRKDPAQVQQLIARQLSIAPDYLLLYVDLCIYLLALNDFPGAWQAITSAWKISSSSYLVLSTMTFFFIKTENFEMAEKTCRLLLDLAPHDMVALGMFTQCLIGQGRYEDALRVGVPVVELSSQVGELPDRMGVFLVKKMADYLLQKHDFVAAVRLWNAGVLCQPGDVNVLLELSQACLLAGDRPAARLALEKAAALTQAAGQTALREKVLAALAQVDLPVEP
jgi:tetratricopeptide (TPR) repeat protein